MCASNACQRALLEQLGRLGTWADRSQIDGTVGFAAERVDDELALLVQAGAVDHNGRTGEYRLAGTPLARRALQQLLDLNLQRRVLGQPQRDGSTRLALALRQPDGALVMAELALPDTARDLAAQWELAQRVARALGPQPEPAP